MVERMLLELEVLQVGAVNGISASAGVAVIPAGAQPRAN